MSYTLTKIHIFFIAGIILFFLSCEKDTPYEQTVPEVRMNLSISTFSFVSLQTLLTPTYIQYANGQILGYNGHGVYIIQVEEGRYKLFDATCTFKGTTENHLDIDKHLELLEGKPMIVVCPVCHSTFDLFNGTPQKGPAKIPLRSYQVSYQNNLLHVFN